MRKFYDDRVAAFDAKMAMDAGTGGTGTGGTGGTGTGGTDGTRDDDAGTGVDRFSLEELEHLGHA